MAYILTVCDSYSLDFAKSDLESIGELAAKYKHRLASASNNIVSFYNLLMNQMITQTLHPGQFNQLGSPNPGVVENTIRDLSCEYLLLILHMTLTLTCEYADHASMLDLMKLPPDSIMIM